MQEMTRWIESLAESWNYIGGEPLTITGRYVSRENVVSDGPFIESKEGVSGYMLVNAENLDQAASFRANLSARITGFHGGIRSPADPAA